MSIYNENYRCCVECNRDTTQKDVEYESKLGDPLCESCYLEEQEEAEDEDNVCEYCGYSNCQCDATWDAIQEGTI